MRNYITVVVSVLIADDSQCNGQKIKNFTPRCTRNERASYFGNQILDKTKHCRIRTTIVLRPLSRGRAISVVTLQYFICLLDVNAKPYSIIQWHGILRNRLGFSCDKRPTAQLRSPERYRVLINFIFLPSVRSCCQRN